MRFDANGAAAVKRDSRDIKLLPMHHMLLPQDKVHYLQVSRELAGAAPQPTSFSVSLPRLCVLLTLFSEKVSATRLLFCLFKSSITCLLLCFPGPYLPENVT